MWKIYNPEIEIISLEYFPSTIVISISKYESAVGDSEVFFSCSSLGYMSSIANEMMYYSMSANHQYTALYY